MKIVIVIEDREPTADDVANVRVNFTQFQNDKAEPDSHAQALCNMIDQAIDDYFELHGDPDFVAKPGDVSCLH